MKIKKLFHWLYAILMLLPVFYIGGRTLYTIFNKNAKDSYSEKYVNSTINLSSGNQLISGREFYVTRTTNTAQTYMYGFSSISLDLQSLTGSTANFNCINGLGDGRIQVRVWNFTTNTGSNLTTLTINNINTFSFVSSGEWYNNNGTGSFVNTKWLVQYNEYTLVSLDNAFEYSVNQLNEVPLFSWATTSFLNQPFTYISGLFGIAADNPINTMLSYWLSISIIWLVFDLIMYVPLLVHRWIDKGGID